MCFEKMLLKKVNISEKCRKQHKMQNNLQKTTKTTTKTIKNEG